MDNGESWEKISPDLTYNDPDEMGDIPYQTITTISESPLKFGLIYIGTDDGKVQVTRDGGEEWNEIMKGLPYKRWVSRVAASSYKESRVYLTPASRLLPIRNPGFISRSTENEMTT